MHLIEVAFKGNRKEFFSWDGEEPPPLRAPVIVEADRGEDLGMVNATGDLAQKRNDGCAHGCGTAMPTRKAMRVAGPHEVRQGREVRAQDDQARQRAAERVKAHGLVMKVSDAEWQWDRKKLTLYFTADRRVDFRNLVRDLASAFRTRIELKQYGVRDEAKRLDGVGRCGRQFCSASWLPELRPVNLGVAKDQHLSLNPSQISGACGRLMCCLRYEHEFYVKSRKRFPKEGKLLTTGRGEEKVIANDIFNERVTLRGADGETRVIVLSELRLELAAKGQALPGGAQSDGGLVVDPSGPENGDREYDEGVQGAGEGMIDAVERYAETDEDGEVDTNLIDADWETSRHETTAAPSPVSAAPNRPKTEGPSGQRRRTAPPRRPAESKTPPASASTTATVPTSASDAAPAARPGVPLPSPDPSDEQAPATTGQAASEAPRRRRGRRGGRRGRGAGEGGDGGRGPSASGSASGGPEPQADGDPDGGSAEAGPAQTAG